VGKGEGGGMKDKWAEGAIFDCGLRLEEPPALAEWWSKGEHVLDCRSPKGCSEGGGVS